MNAWIVLAIFAFGVMVGWRGEVIYNGYKQSNAIELAQNNVIQKERADILLTNKETDTHDKLIKKLDDSFTAYLASLQQPTGNSLPKTPYGPYQDVTKACSDRLSRVIQKYTEIQRRTDQQVAELIKQGADQTADFQWCQSWIIGHSGR